MVFRQLSKIFSNFEAVIELLSGHHNPKDKKKTEIQIPLKFQWQGITPAAVKAVAAQVVINSLSGHPRLTVIGGSGETHGQKSTHRCNR